MLQTPAYVQQKFSHLHINSVV
uniref:Uncharacterized protein n=1 Tax=Anguilla anguilla TaxID=7936 RepID=A0A0E9RHL3_ANGAN